MNPCSILFFSLFLIISNCFAVPSKPVCSCTYLVNQAAPQGNPLTRLFHRKKTLSKPTATASSAAVHDIESQRQTAMMPLNYESKLDQGEPAQTDSQRKDSSNIHYGNDQDVDDVNQGQPVVRISPFDLPNDQDEKEGDDQDEKYDNDPQDSNESKSSLKSSDFTADDLEWELAAANQHDSEGIGLL